MEVKTKVQSALDIPLDVLHSTEVRLPWVVHVKVDLLNSICNIQASEGEVLKSSSYTAVMGGVSHRSPISRELGVSIHRGAARLAVTHTSTVQDI